MELPSVGFQIIGVVLAAIVFMFVRMYKNWPRDWDKDQDGDFPTSFLAEVQRESHWDSAQKAVICQILKTWTEQTCGGVILVEQSTAGPPNKYQMIEFNGPSKLRQLPMVEVQWSYVSALPRARAFLKGEKTELMQLSPENFRLVFDHMASYCRTDGMIDVPARCKIYEGYFSPRR